MKNRKNRLENYCAIEKFIKDHGSDQLLLMWDELSESDIEGLRDCVRNKKRNEALVDAANSLSDTLTRNTKAKVIFGVADDFGLLKLEECRKGISFELEFIESCVLTAFNSGSKFPISVTQIDNIIKNNY